MGGDGGVIASNRRYLRGAGKADHTGDYNNNKQELSKETEREYMKECMKTCFVTKLPLDFLSSSTGIVACSYGHLYSREAAIEALLRRKQQQNNNEDDDDEDELGRHIRGMKDLYPVRFEKDKKSHIPICPVTGIELNGQIPAYLIVSSSSNKKKKKKKKKESAAVSGDDNDNNDNVVNVISEKAIKEMGIGSLKAEYGFDSKDDLIRLAPPISMMETIQEKLILKREKEQEEKTKNKKSSSSKKNKKDKKRGASNDNGDDTGASTTTKKMKKTNNVVTKNGTSSVAQKTTSKTTITISSSAGGHINNTSNSLTEIARSRVESEVKSNNNLSSLFTDSNGASKSKIISEKDKKDNLFAR